MEDNDTVNSEFVCDDLDDVDIDKLLVLVEARPEIYDNKREDHHNQDKIDRAWQFISSSLNVPSKYSIIIYKLNPFIGTAML